VRDTTITTKIIDLETTPTTLDDLLKLVQPDTEIVLMNGTTPIAQIEPLAAFPAPVMQPRIAGLHAGTTWASDDFDDPLPDSFWLGD
jgi:antitoxin (DNA-binding transcriptional repressor) of toxin-antitoxin stability system